MIICPHCSADNKETGSVRDGEHFFHRCYSCYRQFEVVAEVEYTSFKITPRPIIPVCGSADLSPNVADHRADAAKDTK